MGEGLLIGWGTHAYAAFSSKQAWSESLSESLTIHVCYTLLGILWKLLLLGKYICLPMAFTNEEYFCIDHNKIVLYRQGGRGITSTSTTAKICEEVQGLIHIIILLPGSLQGSSRNLNMSCLCCVLTSPESRIFPPALLHQHLCLDHGSQSSGAWH